MVQIPLCKVLTYASCLSYVVATTSSRQIHLDGSMPNFVFIMTDDQDLHLASMDYMPKVHKLIADEGVTYRSHYCTIAICCPSRVSLLTGKAAHNTNVTDVSPPYGKLFVARVDECPSDAAQVVTRNSFLKV